MRISDWSSDVCSSDLITDITPDPALLHSFAEPLGASRVVQHPDRCIIGMDNVAGQDRGLDALDQWLQGSHGPAAPVSQGTRSEEHTSELQSLMRISYAVICLKKKTHSNSYTN